jgi:hypothetical protein
LSFCGFAYFCQKVTLILFLFQPDSGIKSKESTLTL